MHLTSYSLYILSHFRRGISKFYSGKSKSFTSLADASSVSTVEDLAKPVNPYNKKRKNLLAHGYFRDRNCNHSLKNNAGVIRRSPSSCRPPLHPHRKRSPGNGSSDSSPPSPPPQRNAPWRSFSLSDLQCVTAATPSITGFEISNGDMDNNPH